VGLLRFTGPIMYGHNIVVRLHSFFCTLYTIIYVRFLYPICTPKKPPKKPKLAKKAKIFKKNRKSQICQKKAKIIHNWLFVKFWLFWNFLAFLENLTFFGKFKIFWENLRFFGKICIFWNKFAVCHFGGYIRTT
jgi:hypothetical protein